MLGFWGIQSEQGSWRRRLQSWSPRRKFLGWHKLGPYVQGLGPPRGVGHATDAVVEGITPTLVDPPRRCSRMVEHAAPQVEVGVETRWFTSLWTPLLGFCFRIFSCSIKHYLILHIFLRLVYLSLFFHPSLRWPWGTFRVSILDLARILGSTGGWFPSTILWSLV